MALCFVSFAKQRYHWICLLHVYGLVRMLAFVFHYLVFLVTRNITFIIDFINLFTYVFLVECELAS